MQDAFTQPLPVHPTLRHPRTGLALRAVGIVGGKPVWPIIGASPDDPSNDPGDDPKNDDPKSDPKDDDGDKDLGFPKDTPVSEMNADQRAAYFQHKAAKEEQRRKGLSRAVGGKTADEIKADLDELEKLRAGQRTDSENAIEAAKEQVRAEERQKARERVAKAALVGALSHLEKKDADEIIADANLARFVDDDGEIDSDKVTAFAARHTPSGKDSNNRRRDFGAGHRDNDQPTTGSVAAVMAERRKAREGKKS